MAVEVSIICLVLENENNFNIMKDRIEDLEMLVSVLQEQIKQM